MRGITFSSATPNMTMSLSNLGVRIRPTGNPQYHDWRKYGLANSGTIDYRERNPTEQANEPKACQGTMPTAKDRLNHPFRASASGTIKPSTTQKKANTGGFRRSVTYGGVNRRSTATLPFAGIWRAGGGFAGEGC